MRASVEGNEKRRDERRGTKRDETEVVKPSWGLCLGFGPSGIER